MEQEELGMDLGHAIIQMERLPWYRKWKAGEHSAENLSF